jgi:KDO2-lipid IV(A) lauroyltransferase
MVASAPMKALVGRVLLAVLGRLPMGAHRALAGFASRAIVAARWRKLEIVRANLARAFPRQEARERERLTRANVRAMLQTLFESGSIWHRPAPWIRHRIVRVMGREHVDAPLRDGRGVLVLGGHLGNWELSVIYGSLTLPIAYLYKPPRSARLDALLRGYRGRFGAAMIPTGGAALRQAVRRLRDGEAVGMLFDQLPRGGQRVNAPFFGVPAATMTLPHRLTRATGCAVVMGHCLRSADGRGWRVRFDPVPGADDPDPVVAATAMNAALERVIRDAPAQYLWHYRRFQRLDERR